MVRSIALDSWESVLCRVVVMLCQDTIAGRNLRLTFTREVQYARELKRYPRHFLQRLSPMPQRDGLYTHLSENGIHCKRDPRATDRARAGSFQRTSDCPLRSRM